MSYLVLARKYRPQTFDEVVGQKHVTKTLENAVISGRVAHAILFSGPRGTGKTTVARVLAKILNCEQNNSTSNPFPCNRCISCEQITSGHSSDVFEIDGASNNSVDQIRELRENVKYRPNLSPYKIYIIDEVHMLSVAAFNALLKTLEEPPPYVKFMFATTEIHKIPVTILSRCQRYDMRRVDFQDIVDHMDSLCHKEECEVPSESLGVIAKESGGSVRDALSLLDQVLSCSRGKIEHEQVLSILGVVDRKIIYEISDAIINKNIHVILAVVDDIYSRGQEIKKLYKDLTEHFRNLLVMTMGGDSVKNINLPEYEIEQLESQAANCSAPWISTILDLLFAGEQQIRYSSNPRLALEMVFFKIHQIKPVLPIEDLIEKLDQLQKKTSISADRTDLIKKKNNSESVKPHVKPEITYEEKTTYPVYTPQASSDQPVAAENSNSYKIPKTFYNKDESLEKNWEKFIGFIKKDAPSLVPVLSKSILKKISDKSIEIQIKANPFIIKRVEDKKNLEVVNKALQEFFGRSVTADIETIVDSHNSCKERTIRNEKLKNEAITNPVIAEAIKQFGGKLEIKILEGEKQ